ncbi:MAG TPA: hypothetical protein VLM75_14410 [Spirochaetota bacterium]|nr:hypothetical protein [Spirochaetota bacterium]
MKPPVNPITVSLVLCALIILGPGNAHLNAVEMTENARDPYPESYPFTQKRNFEIGGVVGTPSGLDMRYWITDAFGLDISVGAALNGDLYYSFDLLYEFHDLYRLAGTRIRVFTGFGSLGGYRNNETYRNLRIPVGLSMPFLRYPITLSAFVAPALEISPGHKIALNYGIAARFNFGLSSRIREREAEMKWRMISLKDNYDRVKEKLDTTGNELDKAIEELNKTRGELGATRGQLDKTIGSLMGAKEDLSNTGRELAAARKKLDTTIGELESTRGRLGQATEQMQSMKKELDTAKTQLDETRMELNRAKKEHDDRETDIRIRQAELDSAKVILTTEIEGKEKTEEEKRLAEKQRELDREMEKMKKERAAWKTQSQRQAEKRESLRTKCEARRGIINEDGYCDCREHEQWNSDRSACECVKGHRLNPRTDRCEPCKIISYRGACVDRCADDERMVPRGKGSATYVCVKKCVKANEAWAERKGACVCKEGYYRDDAGECLPRR